MNMRRKARWFSLVLILLTLSAGFGYSVCYQDVTGTSITKIFTYEHQDSVGLPNDITVKTLKEVRQVVAEAVTNRSYGPGYNCLDYAWDSMRALRWDGQPAAIAAVMFEDGKGHTLVLTATEDSNWVFIDPESNMELHPIPGGYMNGKKIVSVQILVLHWVDFEEFVKNPRFEVQE